MGGVTSPPRHGEGDRREQRDGGGGSPHTLRPETAIARKLRKTMSLPEILLWQRLKGQQAGVKFRKQHPVGPYVADFYCSATRTVIEVDGDAHSRADRPERDAERDAFLVENGYRVLHIPAVDVLRDADATASAIAALVATPLHRQPPADGPPPRAGEE